MIKSKNDLNFYLAEDKKALKIGKGLKHYFKELLTPNLIWRFERTLRYTEYYTNCRRGVWGGVISLYYRYKLRRLSLKLGFSIPCNVFGPGLSIAHYGTIVVNGNARIGANCRLHTSLILEQVQAQKKPQL